MNKSIQELEEIAITIRISILEMLTKAGSGHPGSSLSCVELLVWLFFEEIKRTIHNVDAIDRDRFILSKGHAVPTLYAIFAELNLINKKELTQLRSLGNRLQGHPDYTKLPCVEASTGSLGQGLSIAQGIAIYLKMEQIPSSAYCLIGDGEMQGGQIWEGFMSAAKMGLDNFHVFLDYNKAQIDGFISDIMPLEPIKDKLLNFGWHVEIIENAHDFDEIKDATTRSKTIQRKPKFFICHTIKGKGVSFMENALEWHGQAPKQEQCNAGLAELKNLLKEMRCFSS